MVLGMETTFYGHARCPSNFSAWRQANHSAIPATILSPALPSQSSGRRGVKRDGGPEGSAGEDAVDLFRHGGITAA